MAPTHTNVATYAHGMEGPAAAATSPWPTARVPPTAASLPETSVPMIVLTAMVTLSIRCAAEASQYQNPKCVMASVLMKMVG